MTNNNTVAQLQRHRLILTASSGRCGTRLLAELLSLIPGVCAAHEPPPYVDNLWWRLRKQPNLATDWLVKPKLPTILRDIRKYNASVYVETSHMLCKGFFEPLLDLGIAFDLIILSRNIRATAMSFYNLHDIPTRTRSGRRWLLSPGDATNISVLPKPYSKLSDYQLCYWYVLEMELRKEQYYVVWANESQKVVRVDLRCLIDKSSFKHFLCDLGLPEPPPQLWHDYKLSTMTKYNIKSSRKAFMKSKGLVEPIGNNMDEQEDEIKQMIKYEDILDSIR